jgi:two-component system, NarL family, nitrate/nitrite response regulator NarL
MPPDKTSNVALPPLKRLCVVSDVRIYREGLVLALDRLEDFEVVAVAESGSQAVAATVEACPAVVVVDIGAQGGVEIVRKVRERLPAAKVVAFGVDDSEQEILTCAEAGVAGFVCRDASAAELAAIVRSAVRDEVLCSPKIAASLLRRVASLASRASGAAGTLTMRERQVLALMRDGLANKQIAAQLSIAEATVKNHVHNVLEKLHVRRRAQAVRIDPGLSHSPIR